MRVGLPTPRLAVVAAIGPGRVWVRVTRYRHEELLAIPPRSVVAPWDQYAAELEERRQRRLARRDNAVDSRVGVTVQ